MTFEKQQGMAEPQFAGRLNVLQEPRALLNPSM